MIYSINRPHPDHTPIVGRVPTGRTFLNGQRYGTTVRCSCGWRTQINEAPSKGGRTLASIRYRAHLDVTP